MRMKWSVMLLMVGAVLTGCKTMDNGVKAQMPAPNPLSSQIPGFSLLGEVTPLEKGFKVTIPGDSLFEKGHSHLSSDGAQRVDTVAATLLKYPDDLLTIVDYTDNGGKTSRNLRLSNRRAKGIQAELLKKGVPAGNVTAIGKGEADPVASNDTPEGRAKNRRAELLITSN